MATQRFVLVPMEPYMAARLVENYCLAFGPSKIHSAMFPAGYGPRTVADLVKREHHRLKRTVTEERQYCWAVIDTTVGPPPSPPADMASLTPDSPPEAYPSLPQIVAQTKWTHELATQEQDDSLAVDGTTAETALPFGADPAMKKFLFGGYGELHKEMMAGKEHLHLMALCTNPSHAGLGAASSVLVWGKARARELGVPIWLAATPEGRPVYIKRGFRQLRTRALDLDVYKQGVGIYNDHVLIWDPAVDDV